MAAAAKVAAGALAILLVAVLGPAAGLLPPVLDLDVLSSSRPRCFKGWGAVPLVGPLLGTVICSRHDNPFGDPKPLPTDDSGLSYNYYEKKCPRAEEIVKNVVAEDTSGENRGLAAGLIRLHFHDAFVRGCDASVLLDKTATGNSDTEKTGLPNANSLRGFNVIDDAKAAVEAVCPGVVSCADILAYAARDASSILSGGKINYAVPGGRYDGTASNAAETDQLPGPDSTLDNLKASFIAKGLGTKDMVTLSGAHSIGLVRCLFLTPKHLDAMEQTYANQLRAICGAGGPDKRVNQDHATPLVLDNWYYKNIDKSVLFDSDAALNSTETIEQVTANALDNDKFATDFGYAMVNMSRIGVVTHAIPGSYEIRSVCSQVNQLQYTPPPPPPYTPSPPPTTPTPYTPSPPPPPTPYTPTSPPPTTPYTPTPPSPPPPTPYTPPPPPPGY